MQDFKSKSMDFVFRMAAVATLLYKIAYRINKSYIRKFTNVLHTK